MPLSFLNTSLPSVTIRCSLGQWFSVGVLQEFLKHVKHATNDYLVRDTDVFFLWLSRKNMTTANTTIAVWCEWIKIIFLFVRSAKSTIFDVVQNFSSLCVPWDEKGGKLLLWTHLLFFISSAQNHLFLQRALSHSLLSELSKVTLKLMIEPGFQTKQSDFTTHTLNYNTRQHRAEGTLAVSVHVPSLSPPWGQNL